MRALSQIVNFVMQWMAAEAGDVAPRHIALHHHRRWVRSFKP